MNSAVRSASFSPLLVAMRIQALKIRRSWVFQMLIPAMIAIGTIWLFSRLSVQNGFTLATRERYITGSVFIAAMFSSINVVTHEVSWLKLIGELDYLLCLGIRPMTLLLSVVLWPILYSLIPVIAVIVTGETMLNLVTTPNLLLVPVVLSGQLLMTCIGAAMGLTLPRRLATTLASAIPLLVMTFTPVLISTEALPWLLRTIGRFLPSTLIVDLVETSLFGTVGSIDYAKAAGLVVLALVVLSLISRMRAWRGRAPS